MRCDDVGGDGRFAALQDGVVGAYLVGGCGCIVNEDGMEAAGVFAHLGEAAFFKGVHGQVDEQVVHGCGVGDGHVLAAEHLCEGACGLPDAQLVDSAVHEAVSEAYIEVAHGGHSAIAGGGDGLASHTVGIDGDGAAVNDNGYVGPLAILDLTGRGGGVVVARLGAPSCGDLATCGGVDEEVAVDATHLIVLGTELAGVEHKLKGGLIDFLGEDIGYEEALLCEGEHLVVGIVDDDRCAGIVAGL